MVRAGKGDKNRVTMLPESLQEELKSHPHRVRELHERDVLAGFGEVWLPKALGVKYPRTARQWIWQWIFPSAEMSVDPVSRARRRHHVSDAGVQRALKSAAQEAGVTRRVSPHPGVFTTNKGNEAPAGSLSRSSSLSWLSYVEEPEFACGGKCVIMSVAGHSFPAQEDRCQHIEPRRFFDILRKGMIAGGAGIGTGVLTAKITARRSRNQR